MTDGRLVCAFMTDEDWPGISDPNEWMAHAEVKAVTSTDWGELWSPPFVVASQRSLSTPRHCAWPGLVRLRDERLLCTFNSGFPQKNSKGTAAYDDAEDVIINYPQALATPFVNDYMDHLNLNGTPFLWGLLGDWAPEIAGSYGIVFTGTQNEASYPWAWCGNTIWQNYRVQADIKLKSDSAKAGVLLRILPGAGYYECYADKTLARFGLRYLQSSPPGEQNWWTPSSFVVNQWYKITVKARYIGPPAGSEFKCYLGDSPTPLLTVTCTGSPTGSVGLQVDQGVASFDNVTVEELP